jgi:hypothetical protein
MQAGNIRFNMKKINTIIVMLNMVAMIAILSPGYCQEVKTIFSAPLQFHVPEKQLPEIKPEVKKQVAHKEEKIQDDLDAYLDTMLQNKQISKNLQANVHISVLNDETPSGKIEQNLHAKYNYEILENPNIIKSEIDDYPVGKYKLGSSKAALSIMQILKQTVENHLADFLVKGAKVTIKITGITDALQVKGNIPYSNDFGNIEDFTYFLNDKVSSITVTQNTGITSNEQLGLLRSFGVRQFMETYIEPLKTTQNSYEHYVHTSNEVGGKNRRVTIELIVHDALKNYKAQQPDSDLAKADSAKKTNLDSVKNSDVDVNIPNNNIVNDNTFALIIGNEDYASQQPNLNSEINVDFAVHDAEIFKEYCIKTLGLKEEHIIFMKNATAAKMNRGINKLALISGILHNNMDIIVYYSGHGLPDEKTKEAYLIPVDVSGSDISLGIKLDDMYKHLTANSPDRVTVFLDACFSGGGRNQGLLSLKGVKVKPKEGVLSGNLVVFTSSSGEESSSIYKDKCHGMFTYFLLKKLQETKCDITYDQLFNYVNEQVKLQSSVINSKSQTPTVSGSNDVINKWESWKLK